MVGGEGRISHGIWQGMMCMNGGVVTEGTYNES